jgi:hypothetical protein
MNTSLCYRQNGLILPYSKMIISTLGIHFFSDQQLIYKREIPNNYLTPIKRLDL